MDLTLLKSIILGIVEGLTEFAPVSSTAHILISGNILKIACSDFFNVFTVAIQSGAIVAAVFFFFRTILKNLSLIPKIIVGFIPTAIAGMVSPYAVRLLVSDSQLSGHFAGLLYFSSTFGSAAGTIATSFYLVLYFEINQILTGLIGISLILGLLAIFTETSTHAPRPPA